MCFLAKQRQIVHLGRSIAELEDSHCVSVTCVCSLDLIIAYILSHDASE